MSAGLPRDGCYDRACAHSEGRVSALATVERDGHALAQLLSMLTILIIVLLIALLGGGLGHGKLGVAGWSPAAIIAVVLVVMLLSGRM